MNTSNKWKSTDKENSQNLSKCFCFCFIRSSETGEGHFYFTGLHALRLFGAMKMMMSAHSAVASPIQSPIAVKRESSVESSASANLLQVQPLEYGRCGMESEEDWTGTGDDWTGTGASSDSGFINFIRTRQQENGYLHGHPVFARSPCATPPPPVPPKGPLLPPPPSGECHYMNLTSSTMDQDNQYVMINRQELLARQESEFKMGGAIAEYQRPRPATTEPVVDSKEELSNSFTDEDGYCRMVPQRAVTRNGSMPNSRPPPIPPHKSTPSHFAHSASAIDVWNHWSSQQRQIRSWLCK